MKKNIDLVKNIMEITGCSNYVQLAEYLSKKYNIKITKQQINQFKNTERRTITHLFLREALEK